MQWSVESNRRKTDISATPLKSQPASGSVTQRFGAGRAAQDYALPATTPLHWRRLPSGEFEAQIAIENLRDEELLVPSLMLLQAQPYSYRFSLTSGGQQSSLATVSSHTNFAKQEKTNAANAKAISSHIDLFAIHDHLASATLAVRLNSAQPPEDYLLVVSRRLRLANTDQGRLWPAKPRPIHKVPAFSQMVQPLKQRTRTCSPTSLSMVLAYYGAPYYPATIDACFHPATGLYGVWPHNVVQSGRRGFTGAVELFSHWNDLAEVPGPFVASLSFAKGELEGAPLEQTNGHLVVVCGTTDRTVMCNDPAADSAQHVAIEYDLQQFSKAWLGARGAAYVIQPLRKFTPVPAEHS